MESNKAGETITINRNDLNAEMRSALSEVINGGIKNIGELLLSTFCGTSNISQPQAEPVAGAKEESKSFIVETLISEHEEVEGAAPPKGDLLKIISGYLYMALGELKYERKDIMPIMQRIEKYMKNNDYDAALTAYKNAENEFLALVGRTAVSHSGTIEGIEIPERFHDYNIEKLHYISNISKTKTANSLKNKGITHDSERFSPFRHRSKCK